MATIINTPSKTDGSGNDSGWAVAVVILIAVVAIGAYLWMNNRGTAGTADTGTNVNVTLPAPNIPAGGAQGAGGTQGGAAGDTTAP